MIGFAVIGLFWFGHHRLFSRLVRSDGRLVLVNMVLLGLIGVMPFTTGLLGGYDEPIAVALYAANVGIATLVDGCIHLVARADGLEAEGAEHEPHALVLTVVRAGIFFASIPLAYLVSPGRRPVLVAAADRDRVHPPVGVGGGLNLRRRSRHDSRTS